MTATVGDLVPVVSYARISSDDEGDAHGVGDQHKVNAATAKRLGWRIVHRYTDNDRSASKARVVREDFEAMLSILHAGKLPDGQPVSGVLVVADDRLARRAGDYERFVEALTFEDGRVYADARGPKDLYAEEVEGMGLIGVAFSKIESRKIRRRMRRWHRARAEAGKAPGGTRPFGWNADRLTMHPTEAPLLEQAARAFAAGRSINSITREWIGLGVKTSLGNDWSARSTRVTLANPRLCGWRRVAGEIVTGEDGQPVVGLWEPIIEPDVWRAIDAIVTARKGRSVNPNGALGDSLAADHREHKYLLSGILRCGKPKPDGSLCNCPLRASFSKAAGRVLYICPPKSQGGCAGLGRRSDLVDEYVTEAVLAKLEERQAVSLDTGPWSRQAELANAEKRLSDLSREWRNGGLSNEFFFANARTLEAEIAQLRAERSRHAATVQRTATDVEDIRRRWHAGDLDLSQKRAYIREALHAVIVHPSGGGRRPFNPDLLEIIWRD